MIFNLFKAKPTLKDLIPEGFVDIHSHILPGIDDGAKNIRESIKLISEMKKMGFAKIIATPHSYPGLYDNTNESIENSFKQINKEEYVDEIKISYASEYMIDISLIQKANEKSILCLKDKYILVEMSFVSLPNSLFELIFKLKIKGYMPIIAHPERYLYLNNNLKILFKLKEMGCKFQINLPSLVGYYGKNVALFSKKLLDNKLIDFVGTDIHNQNDINCFDKKIIIKKSDELSRCIENNIKYFSD